MKKEFPDKTVYLTSLGSVDSIEATGLFVHDMGNKAVTPDEIGEMLVDKFGNPIYLDNYRLNFSL